MGYHSFKKSVQRNLLIAYSQAKYFDFANVNILSMPVAKIPTLKISFEERVFSIS